MSAFPNWHKYVVHQKREETGCIPTAYEILLRAASVPNIDFSTFQDDFDLDKAGGAPKNHFNSVADAIKVKYPQIKFCCESFPKREGGRKLARIEEFIGNQQPVIVSLANAAYGGRGWHSMVVVDATSSELRLLKYVDLDGIITIKTIPKLEIVAIHDSFAGGDEIAYLQVPVASEILKVNGVRP
jgi:hypothetical protein